MKVWFSSGCGVRGESHGHDLTNRYRVTTRRLYDKTATSSCISSSSKAGDVSDYRSENNLQTKQTFVYFYS